MSLPSLRICSPCPFGADSLVVELNIHNMIYSAYFSLDSVLVFFTE